MNEDGSLISSEITINRSGDATQPASVDVILSDGTATGGTTLTTGIDYNNSPISVNFAANQTTAIVKIPINLDDSSEPTETVNLALANPSNGIALGSQSTAVLDIVQPNTILPFVNLGISPQSLTENETLTVSAVLSSVTNQDVSIHLGFLGTAQKNVDYTVSSNVIVIPAGSTSGSITLSTINDNLLEENESIIVDLS
ncbi:Calx-beta domain-containing protein, partial [Planktothrix mougeotii]|uniref:Calx-beta domain-containing protein n=1 Tax=Planktothrix mougeotii TaxID=54306 RepID=UPI00389ACBE6